MKIETWLDVRNFLNTCTEKQLSGKANIVGSEDDPGCMIGTIEIAESDWITFGDSQDEGMFEKSSIELEGDEEFEVVYPAGTLLAFAP